MTPVIDYVIVTFCCHDRLSQQEQPKERAYFGSQFHKDRVYHERGRLGNIMAAASGSWLSNIFIHTQKEEKEQGGGGKGVRV